jgi:hypothetical protein
MMFFSFFPGSHYVPFKFSNMFFIAPHLIPHALANVVLLSPI